MGAVGDDDFAQKMRDIATGDGVNVKYAVFPTETTGTCACLISNDGHSRSLCAFLDASQKFNPDHIKANWELVEQAQIYYVSGFLLTVCLESALMIAKHASEKANKKFCLNLSAPYISEFFSDRLNAILPYCDIVFGNETEALAFAKMKGWEETDIPKIAKKIATDVPREGTKTSRMVVLTQGDQPTVVADRTDGSVKEFPVKKLEADAIVDTNGAGDAFAGGFLAQLATGQPIDDCVRCGAYAASIIIGQSGCTLPKECEY